MSYRITAAVGGLLAVVGLVGIAVPSLTTWVPARDGLVLFLGIVMLFGAFREVRRRHKTELEYAETPEAERALELPTPGDEYDRRLDHVRLGRFNATRRHQFREDAGEIAVKTIQRREGCSSDAAEQALLDGTWTDDPFAAAFFTREPPSTDGRTRVRELLSTTPPFKRRAIRAIDEIYRLAEDGNE